MPASIQDVAPWLIPDKNWMENAVTAGTNAGTQIARTILAARAQSHQQQMDEATLPLKMQEMDLQAQTQQAQLISRGIDNQLKEQQVNQTIQGISEFADWKKNLPTDPSEAMSYPLPSNPFAQQEAMKVQNQISRMALDKKKLQEDTLFNHQATKLKDSTAFAQIMTMNDPVQRRQALSLALETQAAQEKNQAELAAIEAEKRGDVPVTTITEKGVSTKYSPAKPTTVKPDETKIEPQTKVLSDGTTLVWMPGGKGIHSIKGDKSEKLTTPELSHIANMLLEKDPKNADGLAILDSLKSLATNQIAKAKPADVPYGTSQPTSTVLPFPKSKSDAVKGSVYQTKSGPLMWDGESFVPAQ